MGDSTRKPGLDPKNNFYMIHRSWQFVAYPFIPLATIRFLPVNNNAAPACLPVAPRRDRLRRAGRLLHRWVRGFAALTTDVRPALFAQLQPAHTGHGLEVGAKPVLLQSEL